MSQEKFGTISVEIVPTVIVLVTMRSSLLKQFLKVFNPDVMRDIGFVYQYKQIDGVGAVAFAYAYKI